MYQPPMHKEDRLDARPKLIVTHPPWPPIATDGGALELEPVGLKLPRAGICQTITI